MATVFSDPGKAILTNLLSGLGGTVPKFVGWGTGLQTTALAADTGLGPTTIEKLVDLLTSAGTDHTVGTPTRGTTTVTNDNYQIASAVRTATGAGTVTVAGLFDAASGGNLFIKGDFAGIALAIGDSISFSFKISFS